MALWVGNINTYGRTARFAFRFAMAGLKKLREVAALLLCHVCLWLICQSFRSRLRRRQVARATQTKSSPWTGGG